MRWSTQFAYAMGLLVTDGNLSKDRRHLNITSKDLKQVETFAKILKIDNKIGLKNSSSNKNKIYYYLSWGDVKLYRFLEGLGLTSNKSKTIGKIIVPEKYFRDFLRGHFDGDGSSYTYWDPRWKNSYMLYIQFTSASYNHLSWLNETIFRLFKIKGKIGKAGKSAFNLRFAKSNSVVLIHKMYYKKDLPYLRRKYLKLAGSLDIINRIAGMEKLADSHP